MVDNLAQYKVFSAFDLNGAYHQVLIQESDRKFTGFEANDKLYQFCRIPFGITNWVAVFQRAMDKLVEEEKLADTFPYPTNITRLDKIKKNRTKMFRISMKQSDAETLL